MEGFFQTPHFIEAIKKCMTILKNRNSSDSFLSARNSYLIGMLSSMKNLPQFWVDGCQFGIKQYGVDFKNSVFGFVDDEDSTDNLYSYAFRLYTELYITTSSSLEDDYKEIRDFTRENIDRFLRLYQAHIEKSLYDLPMILCKDLFSNQDFISLRDFVKTKSLAESLKSKWDEEIVIKKNDVDNIKSDLDKQKHTYNFISLHRGFRKIGALKSKELLLARAAMVFLGLLIPLLISAEAWLMFFGGLRLEGNNSNEWIKLIPGFSLLLILLYYFRISLANVNSIKAQVIQVNLRMSLCQFIENYSKFSVKMNQENAGLLSKFEEVIFSNIMPNAEKIPSTFDGVEQLAKLLANLKKN